MILVTAKVNEAQMPNLKHNRHNGRDKSGCNAGWAYLGMLAKIKLLSGQEGRLAGAGREIA